MLKPHARIVCFLFLLFAQGCTPVSNNPYDKITNAVAHGIPGGNYNNWSDAQKEENTENITQACSVSCTMEFQSSHIPLEMAMAETFTCTYGCIYNNLPYDYPDREQYRAKAIEYYGIAVKLGSQLSQPTLH